MSPKEASCGSEISAFIPFQAIAASPLYEECKELIIYMYINDCNTYEDSNDYEYKCLRATTGQYFGFEYTPRAEEALRADFFPNEVPEELLRNKRSENQDHFRKERLKWLAVAELLASVGILGAQPIRERGKYRRFSLSSSGKIIAAETLNWLEKQCPG